MNIDPHADDSTARQIHRLVGQLHGWDNQARNEVTWYDRALTCMSLLAPSGEPQAVVSDRERAALLLVYPDRVLITRAPDGGSGDATVEVHSRRSLQSVTLTGGASPFERHFPSDWPGPLTLTLNYAGAADLALDLDGYGVGQVAPVFNELVADAVAAQND